jgi:DNA-binding transcriptional LysR family regulator
LQPAKSISLSTDQAAAFVELAKRGSLRHAAEALNISEQGLRNRPLILENRLKIDLYRKSRGVRRVPPLTNEVQKLTAPESFTYSWCY